MGMLDGIKYQIVLLGGMEAAKGKLRERLKLRLAELGVDHANHVAFLDSSSTPRALNDKAPVVGVYFESPPPYRDLDFLSGLISNASTVIPVYGGSREYSDSVPDNLRLINGLKFSNNEHEDVLIEKIASTCLEALDLIKQSRRIFLSYVRKESSKVVNQLFELFTKSGFDVFLDTASIGLGNSFQEVLMHRLSDTDIVIILDTPEFKNRDWPKKEFAEANKMQIALLQLIWGDHTPIASSSLCERMYLDKIMDFRKSKTSKLNRFLLSETLSRIKHKVESLRARSFLSRYNNLVLELKKAADGTGCSISVQPNRYIIVSKVDGENIAVFPSIGVPDAFNYQKINQHYEVKGNPKIIKARLLYDSRNIRTEWLTHLGWLDSYLPVQSVRSEGVAEWLKNL